MTVGKVNKSFFRQDGEHRMHIDFIAKSFVGLEWQFEGGALHVVEKNVQIVRIDERVLR